MAETPENNKQDDGAAAKPNPSTPTAAQKASLSEKAEKLAARLEEHKKQQPKPTETPPASDTPVADKPVAGRTPVAKTAGTAPGAAVPGTGEPATKPANTKPAVAKKPAAAATKPVSRIEPVTEQVEDVIRAIKLPHEIDKDKSAPAGEKAPTGSAQMPATAVVPPVNVAAPSPQEKSTASAAAVAEARNRVFGNYTPEPERSAAAVKRRVARERALNSKPPLGRSAQVILAVLFPFLTLIAAVRLVATPGFLALAYGRPGFPADGFGFDWPERLTFASYGVDYLNNFAGPEYLSGLRLENGAALFNASEVQHMVDVKNLVGITYVAGAILAVVAIVLITYLSRRYAGGVRRGLFAGAIVTLGLIAALAVSAILGWQNFFTAFHRLFFSDGTWTFAVSDTLIRLYPEQFWIDSAIAVAALVLLTVTVVLIACWPTGRRREASRLRQDARVFGLGNN
ncbi:TIGR01906 family membrane protein [Glutamicibacter sp. MNS18]|uniref:TIGR01906 family membrane protein n=1 Tax=Glutamicibacter sp. MNS18 TaxID=2989817 RepID=UPI0022368FAE|nr:TIGR01906 family membrane protein [Glutamicibacter sp. MNS18]MCW4465106.1 TIGR01906 family membrane protein [Glutamicibacter sp. MNS18]